MTDTRVSSATRRSTLRVAGQPEPRRPPSKVGRLLAAATFLFAVFGTVTGGISFFRSQDIDVSVTATQSTFDLRSVDVGVINSSQRAVAITDGTLTFDGMTVGRVARLIPGGGDESRREVERLAVAQPLPYALASGQVFAGTLEWSVAYVTHSPEMLARLEQRLRRPRSSDDPPDDRFRLVLELEPGGRKETAVRIAVGPLTDVRAQVGHAPGWYTTLVLDRETRAVRSLAVHANDPGANVARLEVWDHGRAAIHSATRPVVPTGRTTFVLPPNARRGTHDWAIAAGGETVAVGRFRSPCPREKTESGVQQYGDAVEIESHRCSSPER